MSLVLVLIYSEEHTVRQADTCNETRWSGSHSATAKPMVMVFGRRIRRLPPVTVSRIEDKIRGAIMKRIFGFALVCLIAACGGGTQSSTSSTTTAAGQKASNPNNATENSGIAPAQPGDARAIDKTPFNK
jgi:hypothetical protein